jgi:hypothetical protein
MNRLVTAIDRAALLVFVTVSLTSLSGCGSDSPATANPDARDAVASGQMDGGPVDTKNSDATVSATTPDAAGDTSTQAPDTRADVVADATTATADTRTDVADGGCTQAPVALGGAGAFVVLAGTTVTNTGASSLTGDIGVSPGTALTGFGAATIVGAQHAADTTAAQAEADLTTAYNDAAGRTLCPIGVAGNLGGQTLTPGLYKSTTSLEISSGDLTLDALGNANAVFIFQMASTLTTSAGRQIILSGSARAANIFWQVGSSATFGSTSAFQGTVMADQAIALTTGATLTGRALARSAGVTLEANTIVRPTP